MSGWVLLTLLQATSSISSARAESCLAPATVQATSEAFGQRLVVTPDTILHIRQLLRQRRFSDLDARFAAYDRAWRLDVRNDDAWQTAYMESFYRVVPGFQALLSMWVAASPDSPHARIARAMQYQALGWRARGHEYLKNTSDSSRAQFRRWLERAQPDVEAAVRLDPSNVQGRLRMASVHRGLGDRDAMGADFEAAVRLSPASAVVWEQFMEAMRPRWYGSLDAMRVVAQLSQEMAPRNPRLRALRGYPYWEQGEVLIDKGDTARALAKYDTALTFGDAKPFRMSRANIYFRREQYDLALDDLICAAAITPAAPEVLALKGMAVINGLWNDTTRASESPRFLGVQDVRTAAAIDPADEMVQWALAALRRYWPAERP